MEQDDYTKEEIDWSYVEFVDNQDVLDLIEKVPVRSTSCSIRNIIYGFSPCSACRNLEE